jgi:hypothetical protein
MTADDQPYLYECQVLIDLKEAGLTHSPGKGDGCGGNHVVPAEAVTIDLAEAGLVAAEDLPDIGAALQALHEQAHPDGTLSWLQCRERGCADAADNKWDWS